MYGIKSQKWLFVCFNRFKKKLPFSMTVSEFGSGFVSDKGVATNKGKGKKKAKFG